ncbi:MAG: twin-arginine translocation signal domain-containing protein [Sphingobacteriaceae bacterium]|nr:MAG: twin-arginine translocation signal domain-containing protein [Sphingobacteriaceae bacterium]
MSEINRRSFIKTAGMAGAVLGLSNEASAFSLFDHPAKLKNTLPRWRGFNLLDFYTSRPLSFTRRNTSSLTTEDDLKWMSDWGFDFVRIPVQYPCYVNFNPGSDNSKHITPEEVLSFNERAIEEIEKLIFLVHKHDLHVSLNLHRVPGYCVNSGFHEPYNLWKDEAAQQALYAHWEMWAKRFKNISKEKLSFDLINEPCYREDMNDQFSKKSALPGELYRKIAQGCLNVIHKENPDRLVVADGNNSGGDVTPALNDLKIGQSCRGYFPGVVSHYRAPWVWKNPADAPLPVWPGTIEGKQYSRKSFEAFYSPWVELVKKGVGVHCGECGCYQETPHDVFLPWLNDMLDVLTKNEIGYAFWNFRGDFGILDSGRKDVDYEDWHGHKLDRKMLNLLQKY